MNTLKELVNKIYNDLQKSDWIKQYPDLTEKRVVADSLEVIALDIIPDFVEKDKLEIFVNDSENNYSEETFKKYITNYSEFLDSVEQEFYNGLLMGLAEE